MSSLNCRRLLPVFTVIKNTATPTPGTPIRISDDCTLKPLAFQDIVKTLELEEPRL